MRWLPTCSYLEDKAVALTALVDARKSILCQQTTTKGSGSRDCHFAHAVSV